MPPSNFDGQWFPMKRSFWMSGLIGILLKGNKGIGVTDDALVLKGFGTKSIAWDDVVDIRPVSRGGIAGALLKACEVETKSQGTLNLPVHQTKDSQGLIAALKAKGFLADVE